MPFLSFLFKRPKTTTQSTQNVEEAFKYPHIAGPLLSAEANLFGGTLLPLDVSRYADLAQLAVGGAPQRMVQPVTNAVRTAQSMLSGAMGGQGAPNFDADQYITQMIQRLQQEAPGFLAQMGPLVNPALARLAQAMTTKTTSDTRTRGGGPSPFETGAQAAATAATIAMLAGI